MGDDMERRVMALEHGLSTVRETTAVFKETISWVKTAQSDLKNTIDHYHETSSLAHAATDQKLEALTKAVEARENQVKGAAWAANLFVTGLGMLGGAIGYFLAKALPFLSRFG